MDASADDERVSAQVRVLCMQSLDFLMTLYCLTVNLVPALLCEGHFYLDLHLRIVDLAQSTWKT